jgi:predicted membrane-bound dolichyl-phosphate-mannose-protein mannosyltransferase
LIGYLEGILKIANLFLSLVAGLIAISLIKSSTKKNYLKPWYILITVLVLFAFQQVLGALRAFEVYSTPYLTHIVPTLMLGLLIWTLILQINLK